MMGSSGGWSYLDELHMIEDWQKKQIIEGFDRQWEAKMGGREIPVEYDGWATMSWGQDSSLEGRKHFLESVQQLVCSDRNAQYGPPNQDFERVAEMLNSLGFAFVNDNSDDTDIKAHHVAMMQIVLKLSRISWNPAKEDSWLDLAGYAACGWDCVEE